MLQSVLVWVTLAARVTNIWSFSFVTANMPCEVAAVCKGFATNFTLERTDPVVYAEMPGKYAAPGELLPAQFARERTFTAMHALMPYQVAAPRIAFAAIPTFERPFVVVNTHVFLKDAMIVENLVTNLAFKCVRVAMSLCVFGHVALIGELTTTL